MSARIRKPPDKPDRYEASARHIAAGNAIETAPSRAGTLRHVVPVFRLRRFFGLPD